MLRIEAFKVYNLDMAIRGMRNPLESWDKSDSHYDDNGNFIVGEADKALALSLIKAGPDHRKFMRQILVSMEIVAPMTWWWDFDTYKVATVKNSTSRMHKLGTRLLTPEDFSWDNNNGEVVLTQFRVEQLEDLNRRIYQYQQAVKSGKGNDEEILDLWRSIVFDLPDSYNFLSTWTGSYETLRSVFRSRNNHKQREFRDFCEELKAFPCSEFILG